MAKAQARVPNIDQKLPLKIKTMADIKAGDKAQVSGSNWEIKCCYTIPG